MSGHDPKPSLTSDRPYANTDEAAGGFSNDDANIQHQQEADIADPNQDEAPLPDPGGERHAAIDIDGDGGDAEDDDAAA